MTPMTAEALELSRQLAVELGQSQDQTIPWPSRSTLGVTYKVLIHLDGTLSCNCGSFEYHGDCPHLEVARKELEKMTTALTTIKVQPPAAALPSLDELKTMDLVAANLVESRAVAIPSNLKTKEDIRAVILAGWEMGVRPMTALRHIAVINGKTEPDGQLMAGIILAKESDARFEVVAETQDSTTVRFTRPSKGIIREYTATMDDAKRAGLLNSMGWQKYPRDMRRWHAMKRLSRAYAPDIINGIASVTLGDLPLPEAPEAEPEPFIEGSFQIGDALYNEGDAEPQEEEAPLPPSSEQIQVINRLWGRANESRRRTVRERYPKAYPTSNEPGAMNRPQLLTADEAQDVIAVLGKCGVVLEEPGEEQPALPVT